MSGRCGHGGPRLRCYETAVSGTSCLYLSLPLVCKNRAPTPTVVVEELLNKVQQATKLVDKF